jgi:hypothetical protein
MLSARRISGGYQRIAQTVPGFYESESHRQADLAAAAGGAAGFGPELRCESDGAAAWRVARTGAK